jgi:cytoskeletal protein CcmA (bactofilin family)
MDSASTASDISVVGRGARIQGTLSSAGSLRIDGQLTGKISVEGEVSLSAEAVVEADIRAGSITLGGQLKGNLTAPGDVSLPSQSRVEGDVHAHSVAAHGTVIGNIVAEDKVELGPEARVEGDITCKTLVVAEGAMFCGRSLQGARATTDEATSVSNGQRRSRVEGRRDDDLSAQARTARANMQRHLKTGRIDLRRALELADASEALGRTRVKILLQNLPGIGPQGATRAMEEAGIDPNRRIKGLGSHQRAELIERFTSANNPIRRARNALPEQPG